MRFITRLYSRYKATAPGLDPGVEADSFVMNQTVWFRWNVTQRCDSGVSLQSQKKSEMDLIWTKETSWSSPWKSSSNNNETHASLPRIPVRLRG